MKHFISKFKIPTVLGLTVILFGIASGVYLVMKDQIYLSQASPNTAAQNITVSNVLDNSVSISWQTKSPASSYLTFGPKNPNEQTVLDDRDSAGKETKSKARLTHYVTLKNLMPKTRYQFQVVSGKVNSDISSFETSQPLSPPTGFTPIIGSVQDNDSPLNEGIAYLSLSGAITQSALIKDGSFLIPISQIAKADLSGSFFPEENMQPKLLISSEKGRSNVLFKLKANLLPLPAIKLGQDVDLTTTEEIPSPSPTPTVRDLSKFDLNEDGKINAADYAIVLQNFGKKPRSDQNAAIFNKSDFSEDGIVDQKDLDLMSQKLKSLGN